MAYTMVMSIHPEVKIGHVHLTVSDLEKSLAFYQGILGFEITQWYGSSAVFLSAGGYHHHIGLNTWAGEGVPPAPPGHAGLYHFAILFPTRKELARAFQRLRNAGYPITGAADHGVSEAIYLNDPDNIGIELYWDKPKKDWPRSTAGELAMVTQPLNLTELVATLEK